MWVLGLCHAAVPPHSSLTSSCWSKERGTERRPETGSDDKQRDVKRGWPSEITAAVMPWKRWWPGRMIILSYKHNTDDVYTSLELIAEYNLRGYGLRTAVDLQSTLRKHKEAEITKCLKWGSGIVVRMKGEDGTSFLSPRRNVCFTAELLTFRWINGKNKHWLGIWRQAQYAQTHTQCHNGEPLAWCWHFPRVPLRMGTTGGKLLFQFYVSIFTHTVGVKTHFLVVLWHSQFMSKGLRAELPVKESLLYELLHCFYGMCVKSREGLAVYSKVCSDLSQRTAGMPSITKQHVTLLCEETAGHQGF